MAKREKDVDMPRRGNFKGGYGQTSATGGAKKKKSSGVATTEAVKKMKQKESVTPKPRAKPAMPAKAEQKTKLIRTRLTDASSPSRSTAGKVSAKSGASRSVKAKVDNSFGARLVRGAKRIFGNDYIRKTTGNRNFRANRPR